MSDYTPEEYASVQEQVQAPPVGTGPSPAFTPAPPPPGSATETDVAALIARMDAMAAQLAALQAAGAVPGEHRLIADAKVMRDLLATHFDMGGRGNAGDVLRLADDTVDAAVNAVASGDTSRVRGILARMQRALAAVHPGPGDHHYFIQAASIVGHGLPEAADTVTAPSPSNAPALGSSQAPVKVLAGSVTG